MDTEACQIVSTCILFRHQQELCTRRKGPTILCSLEVLLVQADPKTHAGERPRALDLPSVTAAFAVLEDICDFIPANLSISDVTGISELQYYIRSALPFGSPVNTNFYLLRMVRQPG
ncbi:unnamed protein product [Symbiodinium necroappetens]|uniref:Uncharacterized protein n=1 Tax=Symbiodinium necroappetens TaxID=1628268 RepID=A0A812YVP0_9DINO|nr:unnamed protein product [Symbiodinium necroappetens]